MNEMQVYSSERFGELRTVRFRDEPWFVASDVCGVLELGNVAAAVERLDDDEAVLMPIQSGGQLREMYLVNEPGMYSLILGSLKPEARAFKRWVTHEVLPAIRQTGGYGVPQLQGALDKLADALRAAQEENRQLRRMLPSEAPEAAPWEGRAAWLYVDVLMEMVARGEARLLPVGDAGGEGSGDGPPIGYEDAEFIYFLPEMTYILAADAFRQRGEVFFPSRKRLYRAMRAAGLLAIEHSSLTSTRVKQIAGVNMRLLWVPRVRLMVEADLVELAEKGQSHDI